MWKGCWLLLIVSSSHQVPRVPQNGPEIAYTSVSFITSIRIVILQCTVISDNPNYFVKSVIFELCYVTDTFPASLSTMKWLDGLAQYANNMLFKIRRGRSSLGNPKVKYL